MKRLFVILLGVTLLASCGTTRYIGDEKGWEFLGSEKINHLRETDVIQIKSREKYTTLRLYAKDRDLSIRDVEVMLVNGDILRPSVDAQIRSGERSRLIELGAEGRQLEKVTIKYSSEGRLFSEKGTLVLVGKRYDPNELLNNQ